MAGEPVVGDAVAEKELREAAGVEFRVDVAQVGLIREQQMLDAADVVVVSEVDVLARHNARYLLVLKLLGRHRQQVQVEFAVLHVEPELLEHVFISEKRCRHFSR